MAPGDMPRQGPSDYTTSSYIYSTTSTSSTCCSDLDNNLTWTVSNFDSPPESAQPAVRTKPIIPRPGNLAMAIPKRPFMCVRAPVRIEGRGYG